MNKILFLPPFLSLVALAQTPTIWQIGTFDHSPVEFSGKGKGPAATFEVGRSAAQNDWPAFQASNELRKVVFPLDDISGSYVLKVDVLIERPRVPCLQIAINGHSGRFYLHPELSYSRSDVIYGYDPHESEALLEIPIPSTFLKVGSNEITITGVDEPATAAGDEEIGGITYDALALLHEESLKPESGKPAITVVPTVFYRQSSAGLSEVVDVFVRFSRPWKDGVLDLEIGSKHYTEKLPAGEFGEQQVSLAVPEFSGSVEGHVRTSASKKPVAVTLTARRKWTVFVVPHTHLDVGYTDYQGKVSETQPRVLTQAAKLIEEHPDFRFSMDGSWNLEQLLDTRSKAKQDEILNFIRTDKITMPAQYVNLLTGYASLETLYRSLYTSKAFARTYGLPFEYANITDVPTYSGSYPSILASSGVKYWVAASNNDRAPIFNFEHWNEKSPFWWAGPDGGKVLFWYSRAYLQVQTVFGLPPQLAAIRESLPIFLQAYDKPTYKPDVALIYGSQVENTDLFPSTAVFATEWNKQYAYPRLKYSTFPDFFHYVEQHFGAGLPVFKGDGGGYWEDGIGSDAYYAAEDRANQNRVLSAEVLSSVTHSVSPDLNPPAGLIADIWRNIVLFAEHTWLSYNSVSQPNHDESVRQQRVKDDRADRAALEIDDLMNRSLSQLADQIHIPADTLVVFNSLNWKRDLLVESDLSENPKLTDLATGKDVPLEVLSSKQNFLHVRFLAQDIPAVGYKCFRVSHGSSALATSRREPAETIENRFYRVKVDTATGSLASIYDKQLNRELADSGGPYKFGQYLYVTGGDGHTQMINPFPALPPGQLTVHPATGGQYLGTETMPWGHSIRLSSTAPKTPQVQTEILLFNDQKKIEFRFSVEKEYTNAKEAVYFAFPVAASHPQFTFATQQGWVNPASGLMKGGSLEWFNVQQWMAVSDSQLSVGIVPLDASLASFGDINRGKWPGSFEPQSSTIFSYAMNNYWHTNYRAGQGGTFRFRYILTSSSGLDGNALTHLGFDEMRPAEVDYVVGQDKAGDPDRPLPPQGRGFLDVGGSNVALLTWKRAEDGQGSIIRLQETGGKEADVAVSLPAGTITSAQRCSSVEDDLEPLPVESHAVHVRIQPFGVATVRLLHQ